MTLRFEPVSGAFIVKTGFQFGHNSFFYHIYIRHHTLYQISGDDFKTYVNVPLRCIIIERTIEYLPEFFGFVLTHIGIYDQDDKPCVEELTKECSFNYSCFLLTDCVLTNPTNKSYDNFLKNSVDDDNNDGNGKCKDL